jgi:hypothetical protein
VVKQEEMLDEISARQNANSKEINSKLDMKKRGNDS